MSVVRWAKRRGTGLALATKPPKRAWLHPGEAEASLFEPVHERLRRGSVHIRAHPGTIERVLPVLGDNVGVPIVASRQLIRRVEVYQKHGFAPGGLKDLRSDDARHAAADSPYVRLYSKGDRFGNELLKGTMITFSAYMVDTRNPLMIHSDRAYSVALSNHADFEETLAYVEATGAKRVVTDNTRNHGCELAIATNQRFDDVHAVPSSNCPASARNM